LRTPGVGAQLLGGGLVLGERAHLCEPAPDLLRLVHEHAVLVEADRERDVEQAVVEHPVVLRAAAVLGGVGGGGRLLLEHRPRGGVDRAVGG
jgi:hypothetical protein